VALLIGGDACTAAAVGAILLLCVNVRIADRVGRAFARLRRAATTASQVVVRSAVVLAMVSHIQGSAVISPTQFAPEPAVSLSWPPPC
jgi:p-aminobenzoyl-glutamate transporter AbgT